MAGSNKVVLPPVPRGVPVDVQKFLTAVRESMQIGDGLGRGDPLDKKLTLRDWYKANGTKSLDTLSIAQDGVSVFPTYNDELPTIPTGVEVLATFNTVLCKWDRVITEWYASTQIFRTVWIDGDPRPDFIDAVQVGAVLSPFFADSLESGTRAVYWIRHVNRDGEAGPLHDPQGTDVTLHLRPIDTIREYSAEIYAGENYQWLRSSLGMMSAIDRAFNLAGLDPSNPLFGLLGGNLTDMLAEQSMLAALDKQSSSYEVQAQFSRNYAKLSGGIHAAVDLTQAYVDRITVLEANFVTVDSTINAKLETFELALAGEAGAIATKIDNYNVTYRGQTASLQQLASAAASDSDALGLQYTAQWGVKTNVAGIQGGVGFYNNGVLTEFLVDANRFAITDGTGVETVAPFIVQDGKVYIAKAFIDYAEIYTLIADNITVDKLAALISITSPIINGGSITGTTLDINGRMTVDALGNLTATGALLKALTIRDAENNIILDANGIDGTYIRNLSVSSVDIQGQAITSPHSVEIVNQSVVTGDVVRSEIALGTYIGGGVQFALSIRATRTVSSSGNDEVLYTHVGIHQDTVFIKEFVFPTAVPFQNLPNTGSACGMFTPTLLAPYLDTNLTVRISLRSVGLGAGKTVTTDVTGFVSYAKR